MISSYILCNLFIDSFQLIDICIGKSYAINFLEFHKFKQSQVLEPFCQSSERSLICIYMERKMAAPMVITTLKAINLNNICALFSNKIKVLKYWNPEGWFWKFLKMTKNFKKIESTTLYSWKFLRHRNREGRGIGAANFVVVAKMEI